VPRRRASEAHKFAGYHECLAERATVSFAPSLVLGALQQLRTGRDCGVCSALRQLLRLSVVSPGPAAPTWQAVTQC